MKLVCRVAGVALVMFAMLVGCTPRDGEGAKNNRQVDPEKPSWWPDPPRPDGMDWPPPRPNDWDPQLPWPPPREVTEAVRWWIERYGENLNPQTDPRLNERNQVGSGPFSRNFRQIHDGDEKTVPGCGLFMLQIFDGLGVPSCDPFPAAAARQACMRPFNEAIARERCRVLCQKNEKDCRRDDLFMPPIHGGWSCVPGTEVDPGDFVNCDAYYLCNCWED